MPQDALDPGPDGTFPYWPRKADGTPDEERMPTGTYVRRRRSPNAFNETEIHLNMQPLDPDGNPIVPPPLP